jgi:hypothetical protein
VTLSNVNEAQAMFVTPLVSEPKSLQFALTVMDMAGPDRVESAGDHHHAGASLRIAL